MKKILNVFGIIFAILIIPVIIVLEIALTAQISIDNTIQIEKYDEYLEDIDIERFFHDEDGNEIAMGTRIYSYFDTIGLTKEEVNKVVVDKNFKKIIWHFLGSTFKNSITGTEVEYPTKKEIVDFIENNYESFKKVSGVEQEYSRKNIEEVVDSNYPNVKKELDELSKIVNFNEIKGIESVKEILSPSFKMILIVGLILSVVWLIIVRGSYYRWMKWFSIATMTSGIISLLIGFVGKYFINSIVNIKITNLDKIMNAIYSNLTKPFFISSCIMIGSSIILFVLYIIIEKNDAETKEIETNLNSNM